MAQLGTITLEQAGRNCWNCPWGERTAPSPAPQPHPVCVSVSAGSCFPTQTLPGVGRMAVGRQEKVLGCSEGWQGQQMSPEQALMCVNASQEGRGS